jgi:hypothetical protein
MCGKHQPAIHSPVRAYGYLHSAASGTSAPSWLKASLLGERVVTGGNGTDDKRDATPYIQNGKREAARSRRKEETRVSFGCSGSCTHAMGKLANTVSACASPLPISGLMCSNAGSILQLLKDVVTFGLRLRSDSATSDFAPRATQRSAASLLIPRLATRPQRLTRHSGPRP